jgi:hypothetical protein
MDKPGFKKKRRNLELDRMRVRICGDDLLAHWCRLLADMYRWQVYRSKGKFSDGKHFETKSNFVFTEILGSITFHNKKV